VISIKCLSCDYKGPMKVIDEYRKVKTLLYCKGKKYGEIEGRGGSIYVMCPSCDAVWPINPFISKKYIDEEKEIGPLRICEFHTINKRKGNK